MFIICVYKTNPFRQILVSAMSKTLKKILLVTAMVTLVGGAFTYNDVAGKTENGSVSGELRHSLKIGLAVRIQHPSCECLLNKGVVEHSIYF